MNGESPNTARFNRDLETYKKLCTSDEFPMVLRPMLDEFDKDAASPADYDMHYFPQDLWAARKVYARRPARHVDVGSRVDGFIGNLLTFMDVTLVDWRPYAPPVSGLDFIQGDGRYLHGVPDRSIVSLSSLNATEHFGLGRYGDEIDPEGWRKACRAYARVLAPGGHLYFSVPIGKQRVVFNAYRVFAPATIIKAFSDLRLASFAAVSGRGVFTDPADPADYEQTTFAVGLFEFQQP